MRVLVTDGDNRAALAIVRSLGRAGYWVAVGERSPRSLAAFSRYATHRFVYPDPAHHEPGFVEVLRDTVDRLKIDAILPVTDITTLLVSRNRDAFPAGCCIPFPNPATVARAADKIDLLRTATALGIPVPRTVFLDRRDSAREALPFPVVVKPGRSRVKTSTGWLACTVSYAENETELVKELSRRRDEEFPMVLQEKICGSGLGVFLCMHEGVPVAEFAHRRLREKPPSGGVSVLSESVALCPRARAHAVALLRELGWNGVAMVEFKVDERDGVATLMEINGRFWGSLQLAIDAGVDFPRILLECAKGDVPAAPPRYRLGVKNRWFWGDVDSLLLQLLKKSPSKGTASGVSRMQLVTDFMRLWGNDLYYENPKWGDVRPWLYETKEWLSGVR